MVELHFNVVSLILLFFFAKAAVVFVILVSRNVMTVLCSADSNFVILMKMLFL